MLNFVGILGAKVLSFPGILGLAAGMTTRSFMLAAIMGAMVGVIESLLFADWNLAAVKPLELFLGVAVGICAGFLGCAIRRKGVVAPKPRRDKNELRQTP